MCVTPAGNIFPGGDTYHSSDCLLGYSQCLDACPADRMADLKAKEEVSRLLRTDGSPVVGVAIPGV